MRGNVPATGRGLLYYWVETVTPPIEYLLGFKISADCSLTQLRSAL